MPDPKQTSAVKAMSRRQSGAPNLFGPEVRRRPKPSKILMTITKWLGRSTGLFGIPFLRRLPWIRNIGIVRGVVGVESIVIDEPDAKRLATAISKDNATFLAPNHAEVLGDLLFDWEMNCRFGGQIAFWAGPDLVHGPLRHIWARHNLIANTRDGFGKQHSIDTVLGGDNVLLHVEGDVHWARDSVHTVYAGVAQLATRAADEGDREVWIQPMLYKSAFSESAEEGLHGELRTIEERLGLPSGEALSLSDRFAELRLNLVRTRRAFYGLEDREITPENFAAEHDRFLEELFELSGVTREPDMSAAPAEGPTHDPVRLRLAKLRERMRLAHKRLRRRVAGYADWHLLAWEIRRLYGESDPSYFTSTLRPEHIAEYAKRVREQLCVGNLTDPIRGLLPQAVARRIVLVKIPEPVVVKPLSALDGEIEADERQRKILRAVWASMQNTLDTMDARLATLTLPLRLSNPLHRRPGLLQPRAGEAELVEDVANRTPREPVSRTPTPAGTSRSSSRLPARASVD